ncbi:GntR family transcriptional regulator [Ammonicoccus fulvus]|uniref:GntR family transcriptional regulator n=1 Tax=Ammonicoccus fulvus TaxID=3138240 RepID=A0ABZ3FN74_9ACTN
MADPRLAEVVEALADEIATLPAGARVMSEHQLMTRYGITRSIARAALGQLESRFLVRRAQGAGTFVHRRADFVISRQRPPSLHRGLAEAGGRARSFVVMHELQPAPPAIAERLGSGSDPCHRLERVAYLDDTLASYLTEWVAPGIADHLEVGLAVIESLDELLRGLRWTPERDWCLVTVDCPPRRICQRLELSDTTLAWNVDSLTIDAPSGRPLFFSSNWTRLDLVRFICEL